MPDPSPVSAADLQAARQNILRLLEEMRQLAKRDAPPDVFWSEFLQRLISAVGAQGGAVWSCDDQSVQAECRIGAPAAAFESSSPAGAAHRAFLESALDHHEAQVAAPNSVVGGVGNATPYLLVLAPVLIFGRPVALVELFLDANRPAAAHDGFRRFAAEACETAAVWQMARTLQRLQRHPDLWPQLEEFNARVHRSLDLEQTAFAAVNEARRVLDCDRVSLAVFRNRRWTIAAISGVDVVESLAEPVVLLLRLTKAAVASGEPFWYAGSSEELPPELLEPTLACIGVTEARTVAILPLRRPAPIANSEQSLEQSSPAARRDIIGALILEQISDRVTAAELRDRLEPICRHVELALANALEHDSIFLLPVWRALGQLRAVSWARTFPKLGAALLIAAAIVSALMFVPAKFTVTAAGRLRPTTQQSLFAPEAGAVSQLLVRSGQDVKSGDPLLEFQRANCSTEMLPSPMSGRVLIHGDAETWLGRPVAPREELLVIFDPSAWQADVLIPEHDLRHVLQARSAEDAKLPVRLSPVTQPERVWNGTLDSISRQIESVPDEGRGVRAIVPLSEPLDDALVGQEINSRIDCGRCSLGYLWFHDAIDYVRFQMFSW